MTNRAISIVVVALLLRPMQLRADNAAEAEVRITKIGLAELENQSVRIHYRVSAGGKLIFVPVCQQPTNEIAFPCMVRIEVHTSQGWVPVQIKRKYKAKLGFLPAEYWKPQVVLPGQSASFTYSFLMKLFAIKQGERLRLAVDVWMDEKTMKTGENGIHVVSRSFACPAATAEQIPPGLKERPRSG